MTRAEKQTVIESLKKEFTEYEYFYITDSSTLNVAAVNELRALCYEKGVTLRVAKNTLIKKALEKTEDSTIYEGLYDSLKGPTALMFSTTANVPARIIKEFRKAHERPVLKAAYIQSDIYVGDHLVDELSSLKSKEELIGDIIALLQSPAKNVVSALKSGGSTIAGLVKALEERAAAQ